MQTNANLNSSKGRFRIGGRRKVPGVLSETMNGAVQFVPMIMDTGVRQGERQGSTSKTF